MFDKEGPLITNDFYRRLMKLGVDTLMQHKHFTTLSNSINSEEQECNGGYVCPYRSLSACMNNVLITLM